MVGLEFSVLGIITKREMTRFPDLEIHIQLSFGNMMAG